MVRPPLGPDEFTAAFARHGRAFWLIASAWVGRQDAADLVQEAARVAWQKRDQFVAGDDPGPWLAGITRHLGANWRRKQRAWTHEPIALLDGLDGALSAAPAAPLATWPFDADRAGLSDEMLAALSALPEVARACLLLHVVVGMTFADIANLLDLPENTAMSHARRARLALRETLRDLDAGTAAAAPRTT